MKVVSPCIHYYIENLDQTKGIVLYNGRSHRFGKLGHDGKTELVKIL